MATGQFGDLNKSCTTGETSTGVHWEFKEQTEDLNFDVVEGGHFLGRFFHTAVHHSAQWLRDLADNADGCVNVLCLISSADEEGEGALFEQAEMTILAIEQQ